MQDTSHIPQDGVERQDVATKTDEVADATHSEIAVQLNGLSDADLQELQGSVNLEFVNHEYADAMKKIIVNPKLMGAYLIDASYTNNGKEYLQNFYGIDIAYHLLQKNPEAKVLFFSWISTDALTKILKSNEKVAMLQWLLAQSNFRLIENPCSPEFINSTFSADQTTNVQEMFEAEKEITKHHIAIIKHSLAGYKVNDPYHPVDAREQAYVQEAFALTQKYFPGLDTVEKMLDFVLHVNIDIPEVMTGQRIEGVYCDIDGTLIDYVPIGSPLEGTQQLRPKVVELLKQYETEGKKIILRTGGDVAMKEAYLRSLGITRPVVSKYDYAGATAEIVLDDTDRGAFVLQSKICAETYIDTRNMN